MATSDPHNHARRAESIVSETQLGTPLERELRQIVGGVVARVAEVEQDAIRQAQELSHKSEREARAASDMALDRSTQLTSSLDALAGSVTEMTSTLRARMDDVLEKLQSLHEIDLRLPADPPRTAPAAEVPGARLAEAEPERATHDGHDVEPSEELTEMFHDQITRMRDDGKSRDEAERVLLRFRLGHRFVGMLDDIYAGESGDAAKRGMMAKRRRG